jgi:hypothetical protein
MARLFDGLSTNGLQGIAMALDKAAAQEPTIEEVNS